MAAPFTGLRKVFVRSRTLVLIAFIVFTLGFVLFFSKLPVENGNQSGVFIEEKNGTYTLYKNGIPFFVKGACGYEHLKELAQAGGNTIRIYDTVNLDSIFLEASKNKLAVIVELPLPKSKENSFYNDTSKTNTQFLSYQKIVNKHKNNSSLLFWCVGNELTFPLTLRHRAFYRQFNRIVRMIRHEDPNHPVTTTFQNLDMRSVMALRLMTDITFLSFNIFGSINYIKRDLLKLGLIWRGPYMLSEWGVDGPWENTTQTSWGAYLEPSSSFKASQYLIRYKKSMPLNDTRFLGSCIFYWGNKQETTHTWFSLFDENGAKTEGVAVAKFIWSGEKPFYEQPKIAYVTLNSQSDNVLTQARSKATSQIKLLEPSKLIQKVRWEIIREDWFRRENDNDIKKLGPLVSFYTNGSDLTAQFIIPDKEGPYRLFATIYDSYGNITTSNIPFYILKTDIEQAASKNAY